MKVVAFNGSPRKEGNTTILIREVFSVLESKGIDTEMVQFSGMTVPGCIACNKCISNKDKKCAISNDIVNTCIIKMLQADAIILASPTYFADLTSNLKALIDRAAYVALANDYMFKHKIGAAVVAMRRAGGTHTFDSINHFFLINQMIVPGSSYWNVGIGLQKGEAADDQEGMQTMRDLGVNIAWLLEKIH